MPAELDEQRASALLLEIYDAVHPALTSGEIDDVAKIVAVLDYLKKEIGEMAEQAKTVMADLMGASPEYTNDRFAFEKKQGAQRKSWDHKSLAKIVADRMVEMNIDLDTGEVFKSPSELIAEAFEFAGVSYWRIKELQKIGVNADSYCEVGEGKTNIIIRTIN